MNGNVSKKTERGLHGKYRVTKDGDEQDGCFVLKPESDDAARAALKAYASATENDELANDLREQFDLELTPQEEWEMHNESFRYEPPELPGDAWSSEQYEELLDRFISRQTEWFCEKCTGRGPISSLQKARRHVESKHGSKLIEQYETPRGELETATDGGTDTVRESENHGLGEFAGDDS